MRDRIWTVLAAVIFGTASPPAYPQVWLEVSTAAGPATYHEIGEGTAILFAGGEITIAGTPYSEETIKRLTFTETASVHKSLPAPRSTPKNMRVVKGIRGPSIELSPSRPGHLSVDLYRLNGQRCGRLHEGAVNAGRLRIPVTDMGRGSPAAAGAYTVRVRLDDKVWEHNIVIGGM
jgi:hypothetical protein